MKKKKPSSPAKSNPATKKSHGRLSFEDLKKEIESQLNGIDAGLRNLRRELLERKRSFASKGVSEKE